MEMQGITRRAGVVVLGALLAATSAIAANDNAQEAKPVPFLGGMLRESHIVYPLKVGDWGFVGEHRYDDQAAGVSVRFAREGDKTGWIDVYFYPVGVVSKEDLPKFAEMERATLQQTWLTKPGTENDIAPLKATVVKRKVDKDTDVPITTYATDFEYTYEGQLRHSAMVVAVDRLYAIKFRYSALADHASRAKVRHDIESFAGALLPTLDIGSSGACWDPPPVEVLAADAPDPKEGVLATTKINDVVTNFAMRDRVLTRRQDDPSATMMQIVVMSMTGRLYDGCTGKDSELPEVPEGMREVRFEFRAPDAEPMQATPMRASRAGLG